MDEREALERNPALARAREQMVLAGEMIHGPLERDGSPPRWHEDVDKWPDDELEHWQ